MRLFSANLFVLSEVQQNPDKTTAAGTAGPCRTAVGIGHAAIVGSGRSGTGQIDDDAVFRAIGVAGFAVFEFVIGAIAVFNRLDTVNARPPASYIVVPDPLCLAVQPSRKETPDFGGVARFFHFDFEPQQAVRDLFLGQGRILQVVGIELFRDKDVCGRAAALDTDGHLPQAIRCLDTFYNGFLLPIRNAVAVDIRFCIHFLRIRDAIFVFVPEVRFGCERNIRRPLGRRVVVVEIPDPRQIRSGGRQYKPGHTQFVQMLFRNRCIQDNAGCAFFNQLPLGPGMRVAAVGIGESIRFQLRSYGYIIGAVQGIGHGRPCRRRVRIADMRIGIASVFIQIADAVVVRIFMGVVGVGIQIVMDFPSVGHAVIVIVRIGIVADSVAVRIHPFRLVLREGVFTVGNAVAVRILGLHGLHQHNAGIAGRKPQGIGDREFKRKGVGLDDVLRGLERRPGACRIDQLDRQSGFLDPSEGEGLVFRIVRTGAVQLNEAAGGNTLVGAGFRLPSALDNRPLNFEEFQTHTDQVVYVSATPADYELEKAEGVVVEQIIRPTGLMDPIIEVRPASGQVDDLLGELRRITAKGQRALVTTLTKRMAEELTEYFDEMGLKVRYLHSDIDTIERVEIIRDLRKGVFDVLVGINLLREGLDLPEVSLVAILDADREGFCAPPAP